MNRPEPRPALRRAEDGSVHPAAPRVEPEQHLHPVPPAPSAVSRRSLATAGSTSTSTSATRASSAAPYSGRPATLSVEIPKDLRKRVRRIAERTGVTVDAVVTDALTHHVTNSGPGKNSTD